MGCDVCRVRGCEQIFCCYRKSCKYFRRNLFSLSVLQTIPSLLQANTPSGIMATASLSPLGKFLHEMS